MSYEDKRAIDERRKHLQMIREYFLIADNVERGFLRDGINGIKGLSVKFSSA